MDEASTAIASETNLPKTVQIKLRTANKLGIWTGGAKTGEMDSLKATSILGGMRFWTAALLRMQGKTVHGIETKGDTASEKRCLFDSDSQDVCALCRILGCTGLSRIFNFAVRINKNINSLNS